MINGRRAELGFCRFQVSTLAPCVSGILPRCVLSNDTTLPRMWTKSWIPPREPMNAPQPVSEKAYTLLEDGDSIARLSAYVNHDFSTTCLRNRNRRLYPPDVKSVAWSGRHDPTTTPRVTGSALTRGTAIAPQSGLLKAPDAANQTARKQDAHQTAG